jgi:transposase
MDKIDARKLTAEGRKVLRQMVIRLRKQSGPGLKELARVSGVHPSTISGWLARARRQGEASLEERRRARPVGVGRKLTMADEQWLREHIVGRGPEQVKLPFALWSRPAIKALIRDRFTFSLLSRGENRTPNG